MEDYIRCFTKCPRCHKEFMSPLANEFFVVDCVKCHTILLVTRLGAIEIDKERATQEDKEKREEYIKQVIAYQMYDEMVLKRLLEYEQKILTIRNAQTIEDLLGN